jgi:hypothetical protein
MLVWNTSTPSTSVLSSDIFTTTSNESPSLLVPNPPISPSTPRTSAFQTADGIISESDEDEEPARYSTAAVNVLQDLYSPTLANSQLAPLQEELEDEKSTVCQGQRIEWIAGPVWDTYAYQAHLDYGVSWELEGFEGSEFIIIRSHSCTGKAALTGSDTQPGARFACTACSSLRTAPDFQRFIDRSQGDVQPHMPWKYLSARQLQRLLFDSRKLCNRLKLDVSNLFK